MQALLIAPHEETLLTNYSLLNWIGEVASLTNPDKIVICDGSEKEKQQLISQAVEEGILIPLNQQKLPGCYLHRSNPNDVARSEKHTYICTPTSEEAGPTNNWMSPMDAQLKLTLLSANGYQGKTMFVIPYIMGPVNSPYAKVGVEITDSIYVVLSMRTMTRMGQVALDRLGSSNDFNKGLHLTLNCDPDKRYICHFPQDNSIWSVGSGYGGNVLLGKKCLALRIGSYLGHNEGWLAEHMLILGVESPEGETTYVAAAFPSACGKTNFAMMIPHNRFKGYKIYTVGDDICWMRIGEDGRLYAINPEAGYFGVVPGTNIDTNPIAMATISHNTIYTNVARTPDGDVWWEGKGPMPNVLEDWQGKPYDADSGKPAAHPNSRFTAPATNNPALSKYWDDPNGVPISAIIFGGRRANTIPLVMQAFNWMNGVFFGATLGSETTAAADGKTGVVRRDPMAMLPFVGYDMGKYFAHWLSLKSKLTNPPKIFMVNWFRKDTNGKFLWPGFSENFRVLKWIVDRAKLRVGGQETPFGWVPKAADLDLSELNISSEQVNAATHIDLQEWKTELYSIGKFFDSLGHSLPQLLRLHQQTALEWIKIMEKKDE